MNWLRGSGWLRSLGSGLLFVSALCYRSIERPEVLGRWSPSFVAILAVLGTLWAATIWSAFRRGPSREGIVAARMASLDLAVLALGLGYAITAATVPLEAGRIANLNLFGSQGLSSALLEWIALVGLAIWAGVVAGPALIRRGWAGPALLGGTLTLLALLGEGGARLRIHLFLSLDGTSFSTNEWFRRYVTRNRDGYRDIDHQETPGAGRRVLVIGDSFATGWGVERIADRFSEQLAQGLEKSTGMSWEPITAAEPDRETLQELVMLRGALHYCPDLVVLLYVFNDIDYLAAVSPVSVFENRTFRARFNPTRIAYLNSYLFQEIYVWARRFRFRFSTRPSFDITAYQDSAVLARHFADLHRFVMEGSRDGAAVVIVPFDYAGVISPVIGARYDHFVRGGLAAGLPIVRIDSVFTGYSLSKLTVNSTDMHATALGHRLAATGAAERLGPYLPSRRPSCIK